MTNATLVFYTNPQSRGQITRWALEEIGAPYETRVVEYGAAMKAPDYLRINPMGKVPALTHGDAVVTETAAICAYLGDAFPAAGLAPAVTDAARADYYRWLFFAAGPFEMAVNNTAMGFVVPKEREMSVGYGTLEASLSAVDGLLADGRLFVAGDRFSMADLYLSSVLGFFMAFGLIEKRSSFEAYVAAHHQRPAALRARELDAVQQPQGAA